MAKAKANSFEIRDKKKKKSAITKMSQLMGEKLPEPTPEVKEPAEINQSSNVNTVQEVKSVEEIVPQVKVDTTTTKVNEVEKEIIEEVEVTEKPVIEPIVEAVEVPIMKVEELKKEVENVSESTNYKKVEPIKVAQEVVNENKVSINRDDFFNLNIKNDVFEGKMTTVRVYDDILETLKKYASMKNYPIIEFTNKVITLGLDDISDYGMVQISEIKFKNTTSRSIMYNLTDIMEEKLNDYIKEMNKKGYKISRNVILNVILNETLKKFYV